ncbi:hypothetical protein F5X99DRAFT_234691 [Biscogniauxia marginata]|nr:hypothetical protein F5X99DRAFT_234691 [Biscogniauxia marginata]
MCKAATSRRRKSALGCCLIFARAWRFCRAIGPGMMGPSVQRSSSYKSSGHAQMNGRVAKRIEQASRTVVSVGRCVGSICYRAGGANR